MLTYKDLLFMGSEAICVVDTNFFIIQHNRIMGHLIGRSNRNLVGKHLSSILYNDAMIRHLMAMDIAETVQSNVPPLWYQGECLLKTGSGFPLMVRFRAGPVMEKEYAIILREIEEIQHEVCSRRIDALKSLSNSVFTPGIEPEDILIDFARAYDRHAEALILPPDFDDTESKKGFFEFSQLAIATAQMAICKKTSVLCDDGNLWCFFPICSENEIYGIACIRFAVPCLYDEEDKAIFGLAGKMLGTYIENRILCSQSSSLFQTIFDNINQPVVVVDRNGIITRLNRATKVVYGYTALEMLGKSFGDLVFPADSHVQYSNLLEKVMQGNPIYDEEMTHLRSDLTMIDVNVTALPDRLDDGMIIGAIFIMHDNGERKRLQNRIMQWEKLSVLGELLHSAANELNNSLTAMIGYAQRLVQREDDTEIDDIASTLYKGSRRCVSIVSGLLDLARENGARRYSNVNEIINVALDLKRYQLRANNIDVRVVLDENIPQTTADLHDVERLFLQIINYAERRMLEYSSAEAGHALFKVETTTEKEAIVVRFSDTGTCILKGDIDEGIETETVASAQILQKIGGRISIDSQIGRDNVVTVELPAVGAVFVPASTYVTEHTARICTCVTRTGKRIRIMVVDDEPEIAELLSHFLRRMDYTVDVAGDGNEAMEKMRTGDYDLIISDLRMPKGFTGDRLHEFIKRKNPDLAQRMIFMTGDAVNPETRKFLQSTGNPYLEKPFLPQSLMEVIQKLQDV